MSTYDFYPDTHHYNGGLGHVGYEEMYEEVATAEEQSREAARRRELEKREKLSPVVAHSAMVGADVQFEA